jgi:hypothetical protein
VTYFTLIDLKCGLHFVVPLKSDFVVQKCMLT